MHSGGVNKTDTAQTAPNDTIKFTPNPAFEVNFPG